MLARGGALGAAPQRFYFPPPGESIEKQHRRPPQGVGLKLEVVKELKSQVKSGRWALWRHGYLVHVEGDFNRKTAVKSLRKTWHALTVGAAIKQGRIPSIDQKISVWSGGLTGKHARATWRHVMTQTSGFDYPYGNGPAYEPGEIWTYSDKNPKHLCNALARAFGKKDCRDGYDDVVRAAYFDAIGMRGWKTSVREDGIRFHLDLEDMGRLGLLVVARGRWRDRELVPRSFVEQLESKQARGAKVNYEGPDDGRVGLDPERFPEAPYGFMTWVNTDEDYYPGADRGWAWGAGAGGSYVLWNHENGIVFAGFGINTGPTSAGIPHVIEACIENDGISAHERGDSRLRPDLLTMPAGSWRNLKPKRMAYARMYSGSCAGGGYIWYFGGAHRGYKGNDVQLYEPRANEWIQATEPEWPEVGSKDWKAMTSGGGRTSRLSPSGRPYTEHTYQQVCWQPERRRFFVVLVSSGTWEFDPKDRKWIHLINRFENPDGPRGVWAQNHVLYEPAWRAPVLICGTSKPGIYKFEHEGRRWTRMGKRSDELAWNEFYSTYVPTWKAHLISTMKRGFFKFDVVANKLTPIEVPEALPRCQSLSYDGAGGVVIALASRPLNKRRRTVIPWAMDVETMQWTELDPPKPWPEGQTTGRWAKLWYDARHNVHLFVNDVRRDREQVFDGGVTETWAFRYK